MYARTFQYDPLRGYELRYVLVDHLNDVGKARTSTELVEHLVDCGFHLGPGRHGKRVADAMRREIAVGRVRRVGRGRYVAVATIPGSTRTWIRKRAAAARSWASSSTPVRPS